MQLYADALFITPKHLTMTVKELTTKTGGKFIDEMVIAEAKILLDNLSYSVGRITDHWHFNDQFFFSKFLKHVPVLVKKSIKILFNFFENCPSLSIGQNRYYIQNAISFFFTFYRFFWINQYEALFKVSSETAYLFVQVLL